MIPRTTVRPAPLRSHDFDWLRAFQKRFGLQADGKVGAQTMAQLKLVTAEAEKPKPKPTLVGLLSALGALLLAEITGVAGEIGGFINQLF